MQVIRSIVLVYLLLSISNVYSSEKDTTRVVLQTMDSTFLHKLLDSLAKKRTAPKENSYVHYDDLPGGNDLGLVINSTKTRNGQEFYELFTNMFTKEHVESYGTLTLEEKLFQRSSIITISLNQVEITSLVLKKKFDDIHEQAHHSVQAVKNSIIQNKNMNKQLEQEYIF